MSAFGGALLQRLTPGTQSEMPRWDYGRPHVMKDWDSRYEQLKYASRAYDTSGRLGWDDRIKMFHISGPVDLEGTTYAWAYHTYNQCRLAALLGSIGNQLDHRPPQHVYPQPSPEQPRPPPQASQQGPPVNPPVDNTGGGSSGWYT
jgi:hypothetical protein